MFTQYLIKCDTWIAITNLSEEYSFYNYSAVIIHFTRVFDMDIVVNQPKHWNADFQISFKGFNKTIAVKELFRKQSNLWSEKQTNTIFKM